MAVNEIEKIVIRLALELYHQKYGVDKYDALLKLQELDPDQAEELLIAFISENEEYLLRETQVDMLEQVVKE